MHGYLEMLLAKMSSEVAMNARREPTREEVARRAHELYVQRGGGHGRDVEDWVRAERELTYETVVGSTLTRAVQESPLAVN